MNNWSNGPLRAMIEVSRSCNLKCPSCPVGNGFANQYASMEMDQFCCIINNIYKTVIEIALFNYGEPLLNPNILEMVSYIKKKTKAKVKMHTNAMLLNNSLGQSLIKAGLDHIRISLDAVNSISYNQYRVGGNFNLVLNNIKSLVQLKKKLNRDNPIIEGQFIVMKHNENEMHDFKNLMESIGVDKVRYKTFNAHMSINGILNRDISFLPLKVEYSRYTDASATIVKSKYKKTKCNWMYERLVINANGDIVPCCYDYNGEYKLGNINDSHEWWYTKQRLHFINLLENTEEKPSICKYCPTGVPNLQLDL